MKLGRPKLSENQLKGKITGVRLCGEERKLLEKAAALRSQKLSYWIRQNLIKDAMKQLNQAP